MLKYNIQQLDNQCYVTSGAVCDIPCDTRGHFKVIYNISTFNMGSLICTFDI